MPVILPGDVIAYRTMWDPYVASVYNGLLACASAWDQAAQTGNPSGVGINTSMFATAPDRTTLSTYAGLMRTNAASIQAMWNHYANTSDALIVTQASDILQFFQNTILQVGQEYAPEVGRYCPAVKVVDPPTFDVQSAVIGQIEGLGILAHGVLQLLGMGASGALETYGAIFHRIGQWTDPNGPATKAIPWLSAAVVAAALAYVVHELAAPLLEVHRARKKKAA